MDILPLFKESCNIKYASPNIVFMKKGAKVLNLG